MENAKKNLVFHFGVGRHASFPQKPVVKGGLISENAEELLLLPKTMPNLYPKLSHPVHIDEMSMRENI